MKQLQRLSSYIHDHFFDQNFHAHKFQYLFQCVMATAAIAACLLALKIIPNTVVIASIGASSFTIFTMPYKHRSKNRFVLGGYIIGITAGTICYFTAKFTANLSIYFLHHYSNDIFGALAVGLTIFTMVITNLEHPPAAALALGLVISQWSLQTILVTLLAITIILFFRALLKPYLIDLL